MILEPMPCLLQNIFESTYKTVHRLEIGKLRNCAKMFAHLLFTDAISWEVLTCIHLNENDTTSSSRIFIKILMQVGLNLRNVVRNNHAHFVHYVGDR